jgi:hypothetical protein
MNDPTRHSDGIKSGPAAHYQQQYISILHADRRSRLCDWPINVMKQHTVTQLATDQYMTCWVRTLIFLTEFIDKN